MSFTTILAGLMIWFFAAVIAALAIGRMIARANHGLPEQDRQYGGECDGAVEQFHAHRNLTASEENHGA